MVAFSRGERFTDWLLRVNVTTPERQGLWLKSQLAPSMEPELAP